MILLFIKRAKQIIPTRGLGSVLFSCILLSSLTASGVWGAQLFTISLDNAPVWYIPGNEGPRPPISGNYLIERTGTITTVNDACDPLPAGSLTGAVALIRRGFCTFSTKINNASTAGAVGAIIYNNTDAGLLLMATPGTTIPSVFITQADGEMIDARLQAGPVILTWTDTETPVLTNVSSSAEDGTYGLGSSIDVTLHFNEPVTTGAGGLSILLDTGAVLPSTASQNVLSVTAIYTVQADENSADLTVSSLSGKITNAAGVPTFNPTIPAGQNLGDSRNIVISSLLLPKIVTPSTIGKGTITPATPQDIPHGNTATFNVVPDIGYTASVGGSCGGTLVGTIYTTNAITADCTVIANFQKFPWPIFLPAIKKKVE